jgi:hypothetical protein
VNFDDRNSKLAKLLHVSFESDEDGVINRAVLDGWENDSNNISC